MIKPQTKDKTTVPRDGLLYHELDMLEIPMFSFESNRNPKDLTQECNIEPVEVDGKTINRKVTIAATEKFGFPGAFSFEVYNSLLYLGYLQMKSEYDFPKKLQFNISDIAELLKINRSGDSYQRVKHSIMQIKATTINFEGKMIIENKTRKYSNKIFSIFDAAAFFGDRDEEGNVVEKSYVIFNDIIVNNMNARYNMYVEYDNYQKLDTSIAKALYLRLYKPLWAVDQKKGVNYYRKEYNKLCEWLLLKPQKYISYIKRQLERHLELLVRNHIISAYDIKKSKNNKTYIIYFYRAIKPEKNDKKPVNPVKRIILTEEKRKEHYNQEVNDFLNELRSDEKAFKTTYEQAKLQVEKEGFFKKDSLLFEAHVNNIILEMYGFPNFEEWCEKGLYKSDVEV